MQYFEDAATKQVYAFEDDVAVAQDAGAYSFRDARGVALSRVPATLQPTAAPVPSAPVSVLAGGLAVISQSGALPPIVWPAAALGAMQGVATALLHTGTLPGGASTWPVRDADGVVHQLAPDHFRGVYGALAAFVAQAQAADSGLPVAAPVAAATIP